jgi:hypothetical protein
MEDGKKALTSPDWLRVLVALVCCSITACIASAATVVPISATATYLTVDTLMETTCNGAVVVDLFSAPYNYAAQMILSLQTTGGFVYYTGGPTGAFLGVAFSPTGIVLDPTVSNRVPDAIVVSGGDPAYHPNQYYTDTSTAIPDDFVVPSTKLVFVTIPDGGRYLIVGVMDSFYSDNAPLNLGLQIDVVPEPGTNCLLVAGVIAVLCYRRNRCT